MNTSRSSYLQHPLAPALVVIPAQQQLPAAFAFCCGTWVPFTYRSNATIET